MLKHQMITPVHYTVYLNNELVAEFYGQNAEAFALAWIAEKERQFEMLAE